MKTLNRFNWIARHYDNLVALVFGDTLHRAQMNFVHRIDSASEILILGGGTGKFLADLLSQKPFLKVTYIEASSEMLQLATKKVGPTYNVNFIHGTQEDIPDRVYDVVITNFFLDLFSEQALQSIVPEISKRIRVNGQWFIADFQKPSTWRHRILLAMMFFFFRASGSIDVRNLSEWSNLVQKAEFAREEKYSYCSGFVSTEVFRKISY